MFDDVDMSVSLSRDRYRGINAGGWWLMADRYQRCQGAASPRHRTPPGPSSTGDGPAIPILALDYMDGRRASPCF